MPHLCTVTSAEGMLLVSLDPSSSLGFWRWTESMFAVCLPFFVGKAEQALPDAMAGVVSGLVFNPWPCLRQWRGRALL